MNSSRQATAGDLDRANRDRRVDRRDRAPPERHASPRPPAPTRPRGSTIGSTRAWVTRPATSHPSPKKMRAEIRRASDPGASTCSKRGTPDLHAEIRQLVRVVLLAQGPEGATMQFDGASHYQFWGLLLLKPDLPQDACRRGRGARPPRPVTRCSSASTVHEPLTLKFRRGTIQVATPGRSPADGRHLSRDHFVSARMTWAMERLAASGVLTPEGSASPPRKPLPPIAATSRRATGVIRESGQLSETGLPHHRERPRLHGRARTRLILAARAHCPRSSALPGSRRILPTTLRRGAVIPPAGARPPPSKITSPNRRDQLAPRRLGPRSGPRQAAPARRAPPRYPSPAAAAPPRATRSSLSARSCPARASARSASSSRRFVSDASSSPVRAAISSFSAASRRSRTPVILRRHRHPLHSTLAALSGHIPIAGLSRSAPRATARDDEIAQPCVAPDPPRLDIRPQPRRVGQRLGIGGVRGSMRHQRRDFHDVLGSTVGSLSRASATRAFDLRNSARSRIIAW